MYIYIHVSPANWWVWERLLVPGIQIILYVCVHICIYTHRICSAANRWNWGRGNSVLRIWISIYVNICIYAYMYLRANWWVWERWIVPDEFYQHSLSYVWIFIGTYVNIHVYIHICIHISNLRLMGAGWLGLSLTHSLSLSLSLTHTPTLCRAARVNEVCRTHPNEVCRMSHVRMRCVTSHTSHLCMRCALIHVCHTSHLWMRCAARHTCEWGVLHITGVNEVCRTSHVWMQCVTHHSVLQSVSQHLLLPANILQRVHTAVCCSVLQSVSKVSHITQ